MNDSPIAAVLGQLPSGLFILTLCHGNQETGMLASWVMQAGFEPPSITVAVKRGRYVDQWLTAGEPFVINLIGEQHKSLISHFGRGFEADEPAFTGLNVNHTAGNVPVLADALGYMECRPIQHIDSGDHRIFLVEITAGQLTGEGKPYVHIRKNGLRY